MDITTTWTRYARITAYAFVLMVFGLTGVLGQARVPDLRIGLQDQPVIRLRGNSPLLISVERGEPRTVPAEQPVTFTGTGDSTIEVTGADGQPLLSASGAVRVTPQPADSALITLLGPSRHYDQRPDRPYRGAFEILPGEELTPVNIVDVESYLLGVVSSEMNPGYPLEALKAQAVAARTYALKNIGRFKRQGYDLDDTARSQVYGGVFSEDPRTTRAVRETAGQVLTYRGALINALYSSTCGGFTESASEVAGSHEPYLASVADFSTETRGGAPAHPSSEEEWAAFCKKPLSLFCLQPKYANPEAFRWVKLMTRAEVEAALPEASRVGTVQRIDPLRRGASGRIMRLRVVGSERSVEIAEELPIRRAFGGLRSSAFTVTTYRDDQGLPVVFAFFGGGWGHGLGMCQVGAVGRALEGYTYDQILAAYYRDATLITM